MLLRVHADRRVIADAPHRSLAFDGESLVDWITGHRYRFDGRREQFGVGVGWRFDAVVGSGAVHVVHERFGTKGSLRRGNGVLASPGCVPLGIDELREIDRSYYFAATFRYPVALLRLPDGREAIAHCPRRYNTLELELLDGTPLTARGGEGCDVFHSRLAASRDGRWLLSLGWIWHPLQVLVVYDVERALREPAYLSSMGQDLAGGLSAQEQIVGATFCGDQVVIAWADARLSVFDPRAERLLATFALPRPAGTVLMAVGTEHVVALDGTPRVLSLRTGDCVLELNDVTGGVAEHQPAVSLDQLPLPALALDPDHGRFAVGDGERITVVQFRG
jgi:hypothetical protein